MTQKGQYFGFADTTTLVRFATFDSASGGPKEITAWVYEPRTPGPHAAIVNIHGGPESQARPGFSSTIQYWVNELNVAVVVPNVRGSTGYGKRYSHLDDVEKRMDSVADLAHARIGIRVTQALVLPIADHLHFAVRRQAGGAARGGGGRGDPDRQRRGGRVRARRQRRPLAGHGGARRGGVAGGAARGDSRRRAPRARRRAARAAAGGAVGRLDRWPRHGRPGGTACPVRPRHGGRTTRRMPAGSWCSGRSTPAVTTTSPSAPSVSSRMWRPSCGRPRTPASRRGAWHDRPPHRAL